MSSKRTIVGEVRIDIRTFATLLRFYLERGLPPTSRSQIYRQAFEDYVEILSRLGHIERFLDTAAAHEYIISYFGCDFTRRGGSKVVDSILDEERMKKVKQKVLEALREVKEEDEEDDNR